MNDQEIPKYNGRSVDTLSHRDLLAAYLELAKQYQEAKEQLQDVIID